MTIDMRTVPSDLAGQIAWARAHQAELQAEINAQNTPENLAAIRARIARGRRRQQAAERGEKWWLVS